VPLTVTIRRLARMLYRLRWPLWTVAGVAGALLVMGILVGADSEGGVLAALLALLWAAFLLAFGHAFSIAGPEDEPPRGVLARLRWHLHRVWQWVLTLTAVVLGAALLWLTLRAAGIVMG